MDYMDICTATFSSLVNIEQVLTFIVVEKWYLYFSPCFHNYDRNFSNIWIKSPFTCLLKTIETFLNESSIPGNA